jgi:hypothetical protein
LSELLLASGHPVKENPIIAKEGIATAAPFLIKSLLEILSFFFFFSFGIIYLSYRRK